MKWIFRPLVVASLAFGLVPPLGDARAAPIAYNEVVGGDLAEESPWEPSLLLGVGINTVSGSAFWNTTTDAADFDSFRFRIPVGTKLVGISFTSELVGSSTAGYLFIDTFLDTFNPITLLAREFIYVIGDPGPPSPGTLSSALPLFAGEYLLFQGSLGAGSSHSTSWTYTWVLEVVPVPEPSGMLVLAGALAALGVARRRRVAVLQGAAG